MTPITTGDSRGGNARAGARAAAGDEQATAPLVSRLGWAESIERAARSSHEPLTAMQVHAMRELPEAHELQSVRDGVPYVRAPDGQLLRMQRDGSLVVDQPVESVSSYLRVGCG